ncbi:MAG: hypothetical protein CMK36_07225 [Porticoccaceae bacterium]|jgi:hypothetical protein|nr:hypothetical protein [Porticoccaceae bacterium]|tara:strand:+ start:631 stop:945 length:315 start_codon:yes stop_codon:yes gene_type:complete
MKVSKEIQDHVAKRAAEHEAKRAKNPDSLWFVPVKYTDPEALAEWCDHYGLGTVEQYEQASEWEAYYDIYKVVNGIRPRWTKWTDHSSDEWVEINQSLLDQICD